MQINWTVRFKNKTFWLTIIPALLLLITQVCSIFGVYLSINALSEQLTAIVTTVFAVLSILGVVNDPTTSGVSDSKQALTYKKPKEDE